MPIVVSTWLQGDMGREGEPQFYNPDHLRVAVIRIPRVVVALAKVCAALQTDFSFRVHNLKSAGLCPQVY